MATTWMLTLLYLSVNVVTAPLVTFAQPSGTVKWTCEPGATWSTKTALSGMSPGGLNSVAWGVAGEERAWEPGEADDAVGLVGIEPAEVGAVVATGEDELHPAKKMSATAPVARPAVHVD